MRSDLISCDPIPQHIAPALNHSVRLASVGSTPPVGIICVHGIGPFTAATNFGPPTCDPGNIFTISAPSDSALDISEADPQPGDQRIFLLFSTSAISSLSIGDTMKLEPSWTYSTAVGASTTE